MTAIDKNLLKYIPKKAQPLVTWLERRKSGEYSRYVYSIIMEIDGEEISAAVDSASELRWAANYIMEHKEFNF